MAGGFLRALAGWAFGADFESDLGLRLVARRFHAITGPGFPDALNELPEPAARGKGTGAPCGAENGLAALGFP
jgi:hypothetical protein